MEGKERVMDKPLGRDSLGRLIYFGDIFIGLGTEYMVHHGDECDNQFIYSEETYPDGRNGFAAWWRCKELTVELADSPGRTNYQRYFADLGTLDEVIDAAYNGPDILCERCPFYRWGSLYGNLDDEWSGCAGFRRWLEQVATI